MAFSRRRCCSRRCSSSVASAVEPVEHRAGWTSDRRIASSGPVSAATSFSKATSAHAPAVTDEMPQKMRLQDRHGPDKARHEGASRRRSRARARIRGTAREAYAVGPSSVDTTVRTPASGSWPRPNVRREPCGPRAVSPLARRVSRDRSAPAPRTTESRPARRCRRSPVRCPS